MVSEYIKLSLITSFGGQSRRPLRAAITKTAAIVLGLTGMMMLWMPALRHIPIATGLPALWWLSVITLGIQAITGVMILLGQSVLPARTVLTRLTLALPVSASGRWLLINAPSIITGLFVLTMLIHPLFLLASRAGLELFEIVIAVVIAFASGFGLANYRTGLGLATRLVLSAALLTAEVLVMKQLTMDYIAGHAAVQKWYFALGVLIAIPIGWLAISAKRVAEDIFREQSRIGWDMPYRFNPLWHIAKYFRNRRIAASMLIGLAINSGLAYMLTRRGGLIDSRAAMFAAAVFGSALATDIRAELRRKSPPEIVALYGTRYFILKQAITAATLAAVSAIPIGGVLAANGSNPISAISQFGALMAFSSSVGVLVSESMITGIRDISGQVVGAAICLALLIGLPKLFPSLARVNEGVVHITLAILLLFICYAIERFRNNFKWGGLEHARSQ